LTCDTSAYKWYTHSLAGGETPNIRVPVCPCSAS